MGFVTLSRTLNEFETLIWVHSDRAGNAGDVKMVEDPAHFLNELPIWKLKIVASEYGIDVSACRYKRDFVEKVRSKRLTEEQVRKALAKDKKESEPSAVDVQQVTKEIQLIADKPADGTVLPADDEKNVDRNLDEALTMRPSFFEVDSSAESAYNKMILGDFYDAIKTNREARLKCLETFGNAQVYSAAVSIRSADELLAKLDGTESGVDSTVRTALAEAKRTFISGSPRSREEALESLETLVTKTYEAAVGDSERTEAELKVLLADYESFGTRTEESRRYLEIAAQAKSAFNLSDYSKFLKEARSHAENAKAVRVHEIDNSFHMVRVGAEEAKEIGADVSFADAKFAEARRAFENGSLKQTVELLANIERVTDTAHLERIRHQRDLESVQLGKIRLTVSTYEPLLTEAASYGIGVQQAQYLVGAAKSALAKRDLVNAAKLARRAKELAEPLEHDLDTKRLELGIVKKVEGAKCDKCGAESVYLYPNTKMKCFECGHIRGSSTVQLPSMPASQPVPVPSHTPSPTPIEQKKRRGLFKW